MRFNWKSIWLEWRNLMLDFRKKVSRMKVFKREYCWRRIEIIIAKDTRHKIRLKFNSFQKFSILNRSQLELCRQSIDLFENIILCWVSEFGVDFTERCRVSMIGFSSIINKWFSMRIIQKHTWNAESHQAMFVQNPYWFGLNEHWIYV